MVENETFMIVNYEMIQYEKTVVLKFGWKSRESEHMLLQRSDMHKWGF